MPIPPPKVFRVFVSSTFSDLVKERELLYDKVYPRLKKFCEERGARFQAVDLRWGVSEEAAHEQRTMAICLDEIKRCRETTARPNFLIVAGDRYGWRPLPAEIPVEHLQAMVDGGHLAGRVGIVKRLYPQVDRNANPAVYCLAPSHAEVDSKGPKSEQRAVEREILDAFQKAAAELGWPRAQAARYGASATEQEIVCGLLADDRVKDARTHVHAFLRTINGLPRDQRSKDFLDWMPRRPDGEARLDNAARQRQRDLKKKLRATLGSHAHKYRMAWSAPEGSGAVASAPALVADLEDEVCKALELTIGEETSGPAEVDPNTRERDAHEKFAADRTKIFVGRERTLRKIAGYLEAPETASFALLGPSGSGKSAVMGRAFLDARRERPDAVAVVRFIGTTPNSSTGAALLASLTGQISNAYDQGETPASTSYLRIAAEFRKCLEFATAEKPLIVFLDALDQLPSRDEARGLSWLPLDGFPAHARLVVSASADSGALA
ncbi:MAG TPA: AAA family ATPase, partial [Chthoniobacterales bacterium]|nr:AAA family ATPase [Chthoniobacterales bacterium]